MPRRLELSLLMVASLCALMAVAPPTVAGRGATPAFFQRLEVAGEPTGTWEMEAALQYLQVALPSGAGEVAPPPAQEAATSLSSDGAMQATPCYPSLAALRLLPGVLFPPAQRTAHAAAWHNGVRTNRILR